MAAVDHIKGRKGVRAESRPTQKPARKGSPAKSVPETIRHRQSPDLQDLLGHFSDARAVIEIACRSLENSRDCIEEASALRTGLKMFDGAYDRLDIAIGRLPAQARQK
jgi:hypothetical protein